MSRTEDLTAELASLGDGATRDELLDWSKRASAALAQSADRESTVARSDYVALLERKAAADDALARVASLRDRILHPTIQALLADALDGITAPAATPTAITALAIIMLGEVDYGTGLLADDGSIWDEFFGVTEEHARRLEGPSEDGDAQIVPIWRPKGSSAIHRLDGPMSEPISETTRQTLRAWADQLADRGYGPLGERIRAVTDARAERHTLAADLDASAVGWDAYTSTNTHIGTIAKVARGRTSGGPIYLHVIVDGFDGRSRISVPPEASIRLLEPVS